MTNSEEEKRLEVGNRYIQVLNEFSFKISESFDRAILTLSSAALSLSLLFIDNVISLNEADSLELLFLCWHGFLIAIIFNVFNLFVSSNEIRKLKAYANGYYFQNDKTSRDKLSTFKTISIYFDAISGISYIIAMVLMVVFMIKNLI